MPWYCRLAEIRAEPLRCRPESRRELRARGAEEPHRGPSAGIRARPRSSRRAARCRGSRATGRPCRGSRCEKNVHQQGQRAHPWLQRTNSGMSRATVESPDSRNVDEPAALTTECRSCTAMQEKEPQVVRAAYDPMATHPQLPPVIDSASDFDRAKQPNRVLVCSRRHRT